MLLAYGDEGPGPVVVLLHGFPLNRRMWESQSTTLGSLYRIITPDLRGHGESATPLGPYPIDTMADDVIETLDALGITEPVVLGGLSMGGYVTLSLALRYPDRWRALMLVDTRAGADAPEAAHLREEMARKVEEAEDAEPVTSSMLGRLFSLATRNRRSEVIEEVYEQMQVITPRAVAAALRGMAARPDRTADLSRIALPTLVLVGSDDQITPPAEARRMAEALPAAQLVVIPDAGHMAPVENPAAVNHAMLEFLGSLP